MHVLEIALGHMEMLEQEKNKSETDTYIHTQNESIMFSVARLLY